MTEVWIGQLGSAIGGARHEEAGADFAGGWAFAGVDLAAKVQIAARSLHGYIAGAPRVLTDHELPLEWWRRIELHAVVSDLSLPGSRLTVVAVTVG